MRSFQQNSRHQNTVRRDPKTLTDVYDIGELKQRRFSLPMYAKTHFRLQKTLPVAKIPLPVAKTPLPVDVLRA